MTRGVVKDAQTRTDEDERARTRSRGRILPTLVAHVTFAWTLRICHGASRAQSARGSRKSAQRHCVIDSSSVG